MSKKESVTTSVQRETRGAAPHGKVAEEGPDRSALRSATPSGVSAMVEGGAPSLLGKGDGSYDSSVGTGDGLGEGGVAGAASSSRVGIGDGLGEGIVAGAARSSRGGRGPMCGEEECPGSTARHSGLLGDARAMVDGGVPRSLGKGDGIGDSALGIGNGGDGVGRVRVEVVPERGDGGHQRTAHCPSERSSVGFESDARCGQSAKPQLRVGARGVAPTSVQRRPTKPKRVLTVKQKRPKASTCVGRESRITTKNKATWSNLERLVGWNPFRRIRTKNPTRSSASLKPTGPEAATMTRAKSKSEN